MPDRDDPHDLPLHAIKESVRGDKDFAIWQFGEFRDGTPELGESFEPS
jgi:hypothetical protein